MPGLANYFELTDVMALGAQRDFLLVQCSKDPLFPLSGMQKSAERAAQLWRKAVRILTLFILLLKEHKGNEENFRAAFYDVPHQFDQQMQEDAFAWLATRLTRKIVTL